MKWDHCIAGSINKTIYAHSWYLDLVSPGWEALIEENYESVFPLTKRKRLGINYLCQPPFAQQLGIFSKGLLTTEKTDLFLDKIPGEYRLVEICLNSMNKTIHEDLVQNRANILLDLIPAYPQIRAHYTENLRRNLHKAGKSGLKISNDADHKNIIKLFSRNKGKEIKNIGHKELYILSLLFEECRRYECAFSTGVTTAEGEMIAGALFLQMHDRLIFLFSATTDEARKTGAMSFLIDNVIQKNSGTQTILDFEGSVDPNLARFYRSFGSVKSSYPLLCKNNLGPLPKVLLKLYRFLK